MVFCCRYIAELALTSKCSAASRRDPPASTNSITRILKSPGYGPRIGQTPPNQCARLAPPAHFGNPDSLRLERAVITHLRKERASGLAQAKKDWFVRTHGRLLCERCGMDPIKMYGGLHGAACI